MDEEGTGLQALESEPHRATLAKLDPGSPGALSVKPPSSLEAWEA